MFRKYLAILIASLGLVSVASAETKPEQQLSREELEELYLILGRMPIDTLKKAAKKGNPLYQQELVFRYLNGIRGVKQDFNEAFKWANEAAKKGMSGSKLVLGYLYVEGKGVKRNIRKGMSLMKQVCDQRMPEMSEACNTSYQGYLNRGYRAD